MAEPIFTAGKAIAAPATDMKHEAVKRVREVLRRPDATDAEVEDALEALVELARE